MIPAKEIARLNDKIISCQKCPRLSNYIAEIAKNRVRRYRDEIYWGKPLPGFGDVNGRVLIVGLAPAAHGGNRTGRMFTGDSSGDWLAKALYNNGFANMPTSNSSDDGLTLRDVYVTAALRCAPPQNKPSKNELDNCSPYLKSELEILQNVKIILCLGRIAFSACSKLLKSPNKNFAHGYSFVHSKYLIICSYHPSRQNTQTGRLTWTQWNNIFKKIQKHLSSDNPSCLSVSKSNRKSHQKTNFSRKNNSPFSV